MATSGQSYLARPCRGSGSLPLEKPKNALGEPSAPWKASPAHLLDTLPAARCLFNTEQNGFLIMPHVPAKPHLERCNRQGGVVNHMGPKHRSGGRQAGVGEWVRGSRQGGSTASCVPCFVCLCMWVCACVCTNVCVSVFLYLSDCPSVCSDVSAVCHFI